VKNPPVVKVPSKTMADARKLVKAVNKILVKRERKRLAKSLRGILGKLDELYDSIGKRNRLLNAKNIPEIRKILKEM